MLMKIWQNFLNSGCNPKEVTDPVLNQIKFFNFFSLIGISSALFFGLAHLMYGDRNLGYFEVLGSFLAIINVLYFRKSLNFPLASSVILTSMIVLLILLLISGGFHGTGVYWFYTFPALAFFLKGKLRGFLYLFYLYLGVAVFYEFHNYGLISRFYYSSVEIRQLLSSLTAVSLLVFFYEKIKVDNEEKIKQSEKEIVMKNLFDQQFEIAGEIQRTYIPLDTMDSDFFEISSYYKPAMEIGGDYFDIFPLEGEKTGVIICDVSSKGIPAALIMVKLSTMLKMMSEVKSMDACGLLSSLNRNITNQMTNNMFITSIYLVINQIAGQIEFVNAGHLPMTIYSHKDKEIKTIHSKNLPLGISEDEIYKNCVINVSNGDIIVLYTDGINEMQNLHNEMYGRKRLHEQIEKNSEATAKEISAIIIKDLFYFSKGAIQNDDIALMVIKIQK
ncbi:MAG: PP2C family protein-serine/threonine phosphatase [Spirochaetia bacterium]|nr:PP2C family protein-serine/threonine phosphatase [Spirochaetia bacterium]